MYSSQAPSTTPRGANSQALMAATQSYNSTLPNPQQTASSQQQQQQQQGTTAVVGDDKHFRVDNDVRAMTVSGHHVWLAHHDGDISVRMVRTADVVHQFQPRGGRVWSLITVPLCDNRGDEIWVGLSNGDVEVYHSGTCQMLHHLSRHSGGIYCLAEYNGYVFSGSNDFTICAWSSGSHRLVKQFTGHSSYVRCLYAEGNVLVSGSDDHSIRVWEVPSGKLLHASAVHHSGVSALCRVGMHIWSGDDQGSICVWTLRTYELVAKHETVHAARITALKKVGSRVYAGSTDKRVSVWDAYAKTHLRTMEDHGSWITCIACPAELSRYYVWSAGADGVVRCWHHDEYRIMNGDAERYDDVRWYYTQHPPSSEQVTSLLDRLHSVDTELNYWKDFSDQRRMESCQLSGELSASKEREAAAERERSELAKRLDEVERTLSVRTEAMQAKEKELASMQETNVRLTGECGMLRIALETAASQVSEATRKCELAVSEKRVADDLVEKLKVLKSHDCKGLPLLVIQTPTDQASAVVNLYKDVQQLLQWNESLRDEVERYKGVLGVKTGTPYPMLNLASQADEQQKKIAALLTEAAASETTATQSVTQPALSSSSAVRRNSGVPSSSSSPPSADTNAGYLSGRSVVAGQSVESVLRVLAPTPPSVPPPPVPAPSTAAAAAAPLPLPAAAAATATAVPPPGQPSRASDGVTASASGTVPSSSTISAVGAAPGTSPIRAADGSLYVISVGTSTGHSMVVPSVPLLSVNYHTGQATFEVNRPQQQQQVGPAKWLNPNVASYVQERYRRHVTPVFGCPPATSTPQRSVSPRSVSPRYHGASSVRPATARGFGSSVAARSYF